MDVLHQFPEIWCVDFEFSQQAGDRPSPVCMVAREFRTHRLVRLWRDDLLTLRTPPFSVGADSLFVAYYSSAEFGCFLALNWQIPVRILDLFTEFKCRTSGLTTPCGVGLLGALTFYGLDSMNAAEKNAMRQLAMRGEPYTADERRDLLDYCQSDVDALVSEQVAQHPAARERVLQVQLVDAPHQLQVRFADRLEVVVHRAAADVQQLGLALDGQLVVTVDHRLALSNPALVSAPSKKSFSSVSCPIFAGSVSKPVATCHRSWVSKRCARSHSRQRLRR